MALPECPAGETGQVLQVIWDHTAETGKWPTFTQLDRLWDADHESDVLEVLRSLPAGLVYGGNFQTPPQDSTAIGLTVAGANACGGAKEALSVFVDFIRVATTIQRRWKPPPGSDADAQPTMTDQDYAREALHLPTAGRQRLLLLLHLLIKAEPSLWIGLGGPDSEGHWQASLDRNIRKFRSVTSLGDYWTLRYKSWESSPDEGAEVVPESPATEDLQQAMLSAHPAALSDVLLAWVYTACDGRLTALVTGGDFPAFADPTLMEDALRRLEARQDICLHWLDPAPALPHVQLTASGVARAETDHERRRNRVYRDRAARNAVLAWLHDQRDNPQGATLVARFFADPRSVIAGHFLSVADLDATTAYLLAKGLIQGVGFEDHQSGPTWARLTADGIDCIEQGGDVAEYLTPHPGGTAYHFHGPVTGTNVAVGDNASQHASISGFDADDVRIVMNAIIQAIPALALGADDQQEVTDAATNALAEAQKDKPSRSHIRKALEKIGGPLARASNQALSTVLQATIEYELRKLGLQ